MIHVCFAILDKTGKYSKFTGTTLLSIFENTDADVTAHILHDNTLTPDNCDKFARLAARYEQTLKFYNVEELFADKLAEIKNVISDSFKADFSVAAAYRLLILQILPADIEKVIYLDSDIIVNLDIAELWQMPLCNEPLGAVARTLNGDLLPSDEIFDVCIDGTVKNEDYFNSGVLLMNLKVLRNEEDMSVRITKFVGKYPENHFFDQDFLNYFFAARALKLPLKFNRYVRVARKDREQNAKKEIYHFCGGVLNTDLNDPFNQLWLSCFFKTPWFNPSALANLFDGINKFCEERNQERKNQLINLSAAMSGKGRVFVIDDAKIISWLSRNYDIRDDEEIFMYEDDNSLQKLIYKMNTERDKKVFFIRVGKLIQSLVLAGFVEGKDFFNHFTYFSPNLLKPKDGYTLIKNI